MGTASPSQARLVVWGEVNHTINGGYGYFHKSTSGFNIGQQSGFYSIYATGRVACSELNAFSDSRIKSIQGISNSSTDLKTLLGIEVTDYRHIDTVAKGTATAKKVIAQQIEKIFPQAVHQLTGVVPDIYQAASHEGGWVELKTDLKKGERVRLIDEKNQEGIHEVLEVEEDKFRTDFKPTSDKVFVYGREVKDFRTVDYDAISMLNVSATQQIKREKDAEVKELKDENAALKARVAELEAVTKDQDARLAAIEKALRASDKPAARTASLKPEAR